jgi:DNA-binding NarL/FixJ family response regulator
VGTLHADRYYSGERVDGVAREVLAAFAEGFGCALERTVLLERMRFQSRRMRELMAEAETSLDELMESGVRFGHDETGEVTGVAPAPPVGLHPDSRLMDLLTRRELEVIELMARGASNADIAMQLVISEGTVKSHVKHILRKTRATNRAQAVSRYVRIQTRAQAG